MKTEVIAALAVALSASAAHADCLLPLYADCLLPLYADCLLPPACRSVEALVRRWQHIQLCQTQAFKLVPPIDLEHSTIEKFNASGEK
jgi:hypothetical protein